MTTYTIKSHKKEDADTSFLMNIIRELEYISYINDKSIKIRSTEYLLDIGHPYNLVIHFPDPYYGNIPLISPIQRIFTMNKYYRFDLKYRHDKEIINLLSTIYDLVVKIEPSFESCF